MTSDELQRVRRLMSEGSSEPYHPKAFVSHATADHPFVEKFAADLRANGVDAWYSGWEIKPGDSIRAKIDEGLEGCEYFIIVLSKNSINRPWVQKELDAATVEEPQWRGPEDHSRQIRRLRRSSAYSRLFVLGGFFQSALWCGTEAGSRQHF